MDERVEEGPRAEPRQVLVTTITFVNSIKLNIVAAVERAPWPKIPRICVSIVAAKRRSSLAAKTNSNAMAESLKKHSA